MPPPIFGACVLRVFKMACLVERFMRERFSVAHEALLPPRECVDDGEGGNFTAREYEITDARAFVGNMLGDTLVDAFVMTADQRNAAVLFAIFADKACVEEFPPRREKNNMRCRVFGLYRFNRQRDRFDHQHHAGATPIRVIVDFAVFVRRVVARIYERDADDIFFDGLA